LNFIGLFAAEQELINLEADKRIRYDTERNSEITDMTVRELAEQLQLHLCCGAAGIDKEIEGGYTSDLLSDVMGYAPAGSVWITLQTHKNIIAIASLKELAAIVLVKDHRPEADAIIKSEEEGIPVFSTPAQTFEITGEIYRLLKK